MPCYCKLQHIYGFIIYISNIAGSYNPVKFCWLHCGMNYHLEMTQILHRYYYCSTEVLSIFTSLVFHAFMLHYSNCFWYEFPIEALDEEKLIRFLFI